MRASESDSAPTSAEPGQVQGQRAGHPVCVGTGLGERQAGGEWRRRDSEDGLLWTTCPEQEARRGFRTYLDPKTACLESLQTFRFLQSISGYAYSRTGTCAFLKIRGHGTGCYRKTQRDRSLRAAT